MLPYIIIASINEVKNLKALNADENEDLKVLIIDEGSENVRKRNNKYLGNITHEYFGPRERKEWFRTRFGSSYERYLSLIPRRCHAETSFGFLVAYEENADIVLELDDDVYINKNFIQEHIESLINENGVTVYAPGKWYNTMENLVLNKKSNVYPRGHPYEPSTREENYSWVRKGGKCVLNMGLWLLHPDLDALTIVYHSGLDGTCGIRSKECGREKVVIGRGTYFAICSMNTSFKTQVIPAFYQLYMNTLGIDRFDDIWSGLFLKKITDHLGEKTCLGKPLGFHQKRSRDTFEDLRKELEGLTINEKIWRIVDEAELFSKSYPDCYLELTTCIEKSIKKKVNDPLHIKFLKLQTEKMRRWVEVIDKLS